jgi:hypothetical protein
VRQQAKEELRQEKLQEYTKLFIEHFPINMLIKPQIDNFFEEIINDYVLLKEMYEEREEYIDKLRRELDNERGENIDLSYDKDRLEDEIEELKEELKEARNGRDNEDL